MKAQQLNRRLPPAFLVVLITLATVFMYLVAVGVAIPDSNGIAMLMIVCACIFIFLMMVLLALPAIVDELHKYILRWEDREHHYRTRRADREHYYAHRRRMRDLEEKQYQSKYRYPVYDHTPRRVRIKQHPKDSTDYGC
jgi:hypothetical protein